MTVFSYKSHSFFVAVTHKVTVPIFGNSCYDAQSSMVNSLGGIMLGIIVSMSMRRSFRSVAWLPFLSSPSATPGR